MRQIEIWDNVNPSDEGYGKTAMEQMIWQDVLTYTIAPAVAGFLFVLIVRSSRILFAAAFLAPLLILALFRWRELHSAVLIHQDFEAIFYLAVHYLMIALSACLGGYLALHFRRQK